jgi:hypothetical protein
MTVADGAVLRVVPTFTYGAISKGQNVYYFRHDTGSPQIDGDVVADCLEYIEELMDNFTAIQHSTVELQGIEVYERVSGTWEPVGQAAGTWAGTGSSSDRMPSGCCLMINMTKVRTGHADRKFLSGFMEGAASGEEWSGTVITAAGHFIVDIISGFTGSNGVVLTPVSWDRVTDTVRNIAGGSGVARIAYQRRRKPGVGLT